MMLTLLSVFLNPIQNPRKDRIKQCGRKPQETLMFQGRQFPSVKELLQIKLISAEGGCGWPPFQLLTKLLLSDASLEVL